MRRLAGLAIALLLTAFGPAEAPTPGLPPVTAADHVLGRADAPVTVIEYGSFACSHCADWHTLVYPTFKARLIDTGQARYVFRNLPTAPDEMSLPAAAVALCAAPGRFFDVAERLMKTQASVRYGGSLDAWLAGGVAASGRSADQVQACGRLPATRAALRRDMDGAAAADVHGTPTFFVNGRRVQDHSLGGLEIAVRQAQAR